MERGGKTYCYHADHLGSIIALTDDTGAVAQKYDYDSYGNLDPGTTIQQPYSYTGREWDGETGLYYYRARYYDPRAGRFISKDPIGFDSGDVNLYRYVENSPVNKIDPYGLFDWMNPITYWGDFFGGIDDLHRNYQDMRDADTVGADKYFHCMGHCEAARHGLGGRDASELIGEGRELIDEYIFNPLKGLSKDENVKDCNADRDANQHGRDGDPKTPCQDICSPFRPKGLNPKY